MTAAFEEAFYLVQRGNQIHRIEGKNFLDRAKEDDLVLVQRGKQKYNSTYKPDEATWSNLEGSDLLLAQYQGAQYQVTGSDFITLFQLDAITDDNVSISCRPKLSTSCPSFTATTTITWSAPPESKVVLRKYTTGSKLNDWQEPPSRDTDYYPYNSGNNLNEYGGNVDNEGTTVYSTYLNTYSRWYNYFILEVEKYGKKVKIWDMFECAKTC
jgi:hypothetical protein